MELTIQYVVGDATKPQGEGAKIIAHCCNNVGAWGAGFVLALSKRWKRPEHFYRDWFQRVGPDQFRKSLGKTQLVQVTKDIYVANIIGQEGVGRQKVPIRYEALSNGFSRIARYVQQHPELNFSIHMPRIGCGLAGGSWSKIEPLIHTYLIQEGIPVTVYDLP